MADKSRRKEATPPPLLLCPPSGGLTLTPAQGSSLLMPVPQTEAALIASDDFDKIAAEADSFVGQTPPKEPSPLDYYNPGQPTEADPFAFVQQPEQNVATSSFVNVSSSQGLPSQSYVTPQKSLYQPQSVGNFEPEIYHGSQGFSAPPVGGYGGAPPVSMGMQPPPLSGFTPQQSPGFAAMGGAQASQVPMMSPQGYPVQGFYAPVTHHWFYSKHQDLRIIWKPFSLLDSSRLETAFNSSEDENKIISVEGGRCDVNIFERTRSAIYWEEEISNVRRCSWYYKIDGETRFLPYEESFAEKLEEEYKNAVTNNLWHKRLEFPGNEVVVMHNSAVIVHYSASSLPDEYGTSQGDQARPRVVKRGVEDFENLEQGEPDQIDHVVFVVHGIGPTCDLRFRNIVDCVDDIRNISMDMIQSHFKIYQDEGRIGRVEFLPVRWHDALHGEATGVDRKLKSITLPSISKLRHFTNDVLLDILFYGSPSYCQKIADCVGGEMNRLYELFLNRNPQFQGKVSVTGHSLGSLILFDLLAHQGESQDYLGVQNTEDPVDQPQENGTSEIAEDEQEVEEEDNDVNTLDELLSKLGLSDYKEAFEKEQIDIETLNMCEETDIKEMGLPMGPRKKLLGFIKHYKGREEREKARAEERKRREIERNTKKQQQLQAAAAVKTAAQQVANNDPLLRQASCDSIEFVKSINGTGVPLVRYPKLSFTTSNFFALGSPIAMFLTTRGVNSLGEEFHLPTCGAFFNIFHPFDPFAYRIEPLVTQLIPPKAFMIPHHKGRKRMHLELKESLTKMGADIKARVIDSVRRTWKTINDFALSHRSSQGEEVEQEVDNVISEMTREEEEKLETGSIASSMQEEDILVNQLNQGRRIDFVLQERPIESFNDYLFALGSHYSYWDSEDTVLMILKEIYALMSIAPQKIGKDQSPLKPRLPPPPMASSPPGSLMSSPAHSPVGISVDNGRQTNNSIPTSGGMLPTPNFGNPSLPMPSVANIGTPMQQNQNVSHMTGAPVGPPPMSGFVRK